MRKVLNTALVLVLYPCLFLGVVFEVVAMWFSIGRDYAHEMELYGDPKE